MATGLVGASLGLAGASGTALAGGSLPEAGQQSVGAVLGISVPAAQQIPATGRQGTTMLKAQARVVAGHARASLPASPAVAQPPHFSWG